MSELSAKKDPGYSFLRSLLFVAAAMAVAGGFVASAILMYAANQNGGLSMDSRLIKVFAPAVAGILTGALLLGMSAIVALLNGLITATPPSDDTVRPALERLELSLRTLNTLQARGEPPVATTNGSPTNFNNVAGVLEQLRDLLLLNESQRQRFAARHWARRRELVTELIERDVLVGDWVTAFARLDDLKLVMPDDPQVLELHERVVYEQNARLAEDIRAGRNRLRQCISAAAWTQADEIVMNLLRRYPGKAEPQTVADEVRRERESFERENSERLFRDISAATAKHQWHSAILALEEFTRRYPGDPRAEKIRLDLPTLLENAAAQERKEAEESFKDLLKRQRYEEALIVARAIIQKYPGSATAAELNKLIPRVEDMARQTPAAPAPV